MQILREQNKALVSASGLLAQGRLEYLRLHAAHSVFLSML